ncbi:MAG: EamA family transporter [Anaerolineae bacterium]|nr:EamA family transporter [Anaerolineae bacterium]
MTNPTVSLPLRARFNLIPPWALVVVAVISVQFGAAFAKGLFETTGPGGVVFLRTLLAGIMFMVLWRPQVFGHSRSAYLHIAAYGIIIAAMMLSFYAAIQRIPLGITVAIAFAGPLGVAVIGSRKLVDMLWVALAGIGVLLLSPFTDATLDPLGMVLALMSALTWAIYILLTKRVNRVMPGNAALALSMCVAAIAALPFGLGGAVQIIPNPAFILLSVVVALLSSAIPFGLEFHALKSLSSRAFGLLVSLEPVVAAIVGFLILQETLDANEIIGIALVTVAAVATTQE